MIFTAYCRSRCCPTLEVLPEDRVLIKDDYGGQITLPIDEFKDAFFDMPIGSDGTHELTDGDGKVILTYEQAESLWTQLEEYLKAPC